MNGLTEHVRTIKSEISASRSGFALLYSAAGGATGFGAPETA